MPGKRKYYKNVVQVTVYSDRPLGDEIEPDMVNSYHEPSCSLYPSEQP